MKKLEMIELEPYEAPALQEIAAVSIVHVVGDSVDPDITGGDVPPADPSDPSWGEED